MFGPFPQKPTAQPERTAGVPGVCPRCCSVPHGASDSARVPSLSHTTEGRCVRRAPSRAGEGGGLAHSWRSSWGPSRGRRPGCLGTSELRARARGGRSVQPQVRGQLLLYPLVAAGSPTSAPHVDGVQGGVRPPLSCPPPGDGQLVSLSCLNRAEKPRFAGRQVPIEACSLLH